MSLLGSAGDMIQDTVGGVTGLLGSAGAGLYQGVYGPFEQMGIPTRRTENLARHQQAQAQQQAMAQFGQQLPEQYQAMAQFMTPDQLMKAYEAEKGRGQGMVQNTIIEHYTQDPTKFGKTPAQQYSQLIKRKVPAAQAKSIVQMVNPQGGQDPSWGLSPHMVDGPNGPQYMRFSSDGSSKFVELPDGVTPYDPYRRAYDSKAGQEDAETRAIPGRRAVEAAADDQQNAPQEILNAADMLSVIDSAINHPGRSQATGKSSLFNPVQIGTEAADFLSYHKQIEGKAFLQAFESLKGGGQITEKEGTAAQNAIGRLQLAQTDEGYLKALQDLKAIVTAAKKRSESKLDINVDNLLDQYAPRQ